MFRLIGFQCVITKASAERAFHPSASLSVLDREEMRLELGRAEGRGLDTHLPQAFPRTPNKDEEPKEGNNVRINSGCTRKVFHCFVL